MSDVEAANAGHAIAAGVAATPDRPALVIAGGGAGAGTWTYAELEQQVRQTATALAARGVGPGDRVALVDNASILSLATILACARLGAASAQMNVMLTPGELSQLCESVGARLGVAGDPFRQGLAEALGAGAVLGTADLTAPTAPTGAGGASAMAGDAANDVATAARAGADTRHDPNADDAPGPATATAEVEPGDTALILFTSGTTGLPKPIHISHGVVAERLAYYGTPIDPAAPQDVGLLSVPIFHIGGTLGVLVSFRRGHQVVALPRFEAGAWLRAVEDHGVASTFLVPTMLQRILDHPGFGDHDLSSLQQISYGAAAAPVALVERALDALPHVGFLNVFGQTETLGAYAALGPDDHRARRKLGSAGLPFPGVEVRIVGPDGTDQPVGGEGEVWVRAAQNVTADWLRTGDLARLDDDGYLHPVGRLSDTINRGGEKFGPVEVEGALLSHPGVRDAGVTGVPDDELGQRVGAVVVLAVGSSDNGLDADELRTHAAKSVARYKLPDWIVFADDLPYSVTGKVDRKALAALIAAAREGE